MISLREYSRILVWPRTSKELLILRTSFIQLLSIIQTIEIILTILLVLQTPLATGLNTKYLEELSYSTGGNQIMTCVDISLFVSTLAYCIPFTFKSCTHKGISNLRLMTGTRWLYPSWRKFYDIQNFGTATRAICFLLFSLR